MIEKKYEPKTCGLLFEYNSTNFILMEKKMNSDECKNLKPCPRCGSTDIHKVAQVGVTYVEHNGCYKGPEVVSVGKYIVPNDACIEACRRWNEAWFHAQAFPKTTV